jgi:hypothetical protein
MARKPDLGITWSKREKALLYHYEGGKPTSMLLAHFFEHIKMGEAYGGWAGRTRQSNDDHTLAQELDARGYDLTTLRFSIRKKAT